jgi:hypothetical protein
VVFRRLVKQIGERGNESGAVNAHDAVSDP